MPGYIWDPKNGVVPESSPAPVEKKRKGLLSIPTTQNVMPGSASSAAAFSQYIPRVNSTVGFDLAYAGSLLATPMLGVGTKAAANVLELTSPSHWVSKAAARLALPTEKALKYGRMADIVVPATVSGLGVGKGFVDLSRAEMSKEKENAWKEIAGSGAGLFAGLLAAPVGNSIVRRIRKVKNLARLDNAGTIGGLDDVGKNLAEYNAAIGERPAVLDRMKRTKINTRVKPNSAEAMASYGRDPNNFGNIVKINPESSAWGLGPEYADALIAHEAEHAVLDAYGPVQFYPEQVTRRPQLQVPDGMKFAPNTNNPLYGELKVLSDANNGLPWYSNPEEVAAETAFLRQLTGQNKNYSELPGFYQKRFRNYIGDQFSLTEPEAHQVLSSLSGKYDYGGLISRLKEYYGDDALDAIRKYKKGGRIYIKPSHRGKFTALKKRTGHSASWFKAHGTPAQKKMAVFALNARKWRHDEGGPLNIEDAYVTVESPEFVGPVLPVENENMIDLQRYSESAYNDRAYNRGSKATGAFQITPVVMQEYTQKTGRTGDLNDPVFNRTVRDWYMNKRLPQFEMYSMGAPSDSNRVGRLYAAFNAGPGRVRKALLEAEANGENINQGFGFLQYLPKETQDYVNFNVRGKDIPGTSKTKAAYAKAKANRKTDGGIIDRLAAHANGDTSKMLELIQKARSA